MPLGVERSEKMHDSHVGRAASDRQVSAIVFPVTVRQSTCKGPAREQRCITLHAPTRSRSAMLVLAVRFSRECDTRAPTWLK